MSSRKSQTFDAPKCHPPQRAHMPSIKVHGIKALAALLLCSNHTPTPSLRERGAPDLLKSRQEKETWNTMAKTLDILLVVDLESTCWEGGPPEGQVSEIIEIGVATLDVASGRPLDKRSILVKPLMSTVSPFCEELTTITQPMLDADGVTLKEACRILKKEYLSKQRMWTSWGDYDRRQFERDCAAKGIGYPFGPTHLNAKSLHALLSGLTNEVGMARALEDLGLTLEGTHHRGHDDAWNIAKILGHILAHSPLRA